MLSYRSLGPISTDNRLDLDQQSITLYSGKYTSGQRLTFTSSSQYPIINITSTIRAQSFVITGQHDANPTTPEDSRAPVFNIFWDLNASVDGRSLCVQLINLNPQEERFKMHIQNEMEYIDKDGITTQIQFNALRYYTYQVVLANPRLCAERFDVTASTITKLSSFTEIL